MNKEWKTHADALEYLFKTAMANGHVVCVALEGDHGYPGRLIDETLDALTCKHGRLVAETFRIVSNNDIDEAGYSWAARISEREIGDEDSARPGPHQGFGSRFWTSGGDCES